MATMREHLRAAHQQAAEHHQKAAKSHQELADCFKAMEGDGFAKVSREHCTLAKCHTDAAVFHQENANGLERAISDELNKIRPDRFSSVATVDAPSGAFGIRAVPRTGSPAMASAVDKAAVPPQFRHLISNMEEIA